MRIGYTTGVFDLFHIGHLTLGVGDADIFRKSTVKKLTGFKNVVSFLGGEKAWKKADSRI